MTRRDPPGRAVVVLGLMASGKTTVGSRLAQRWRLPFRDSDADLLTRTGRTAAELAVELGEDGLHALESQHLLDSLAGPVCVIAAAAAVVDDPRCREALDRPLVVWLDADPETLARRHSRGGHRPAYRSDLVGMLREMDLRRRPLFTEVADLVVRLPPDPADPDDAGPAGGHAAGSGGAPGDQRIDALVDTVLDGLARLDR